MEVVGVPVVDDDDGGDAVSVVEVENREVGVEEKGRENVEEKEAVAVEASALDTRVRLWLMQNGESVSAPPQVCPSAQQMDPHWKSPAAHTRVQLAVPAPAPDGQQKKVPLMDEHVSPAPPTSEGNVRGLRLVSFETHRLTTPTALRACRFAASAGGPARLAVPKRRRNAHARDSGPGRAEEECSRRH